MGQLGFLSVWVAVVSWICCWCRSRWSFGFFCTFDCCRGLIYHDGWRWSDLPIVGWVYSLRFMGFLSSQVFYVFGFLVCSLRFMGFLRFICFCRLVAKKMQVKKKKKSNHDLFFNFLGNQTCSWERTWRAWTKMRTNTKTWTITCYCKKLMTWKK